MAPQIRHALPGVEWSILVEGDEQGGVGQTQRRRLTTCGRHQGIGTSSVVSASSSASSRVSPASAREGDRDERKFGIDFDIDDLGDAQAIVAIARLTGGNFRLIQWLFAQMARVLTINELSLITSDVTDAASSTLVLGAT